MSEPHPTPLREILRRIDRENEKAWLYLSAEEKWKLSSPALVLESEEVPPEMEDDPEAGVPEIARRLKMMQALPVTVVQDIVRNATSQKADASDDDLVRAFLHYYDHDAFINLR
jgi:hypothetical protein